MLGSMVYRRLNTVDGLQVTGTARQEGNELIVFNVYDGLDNLQVEGVDYIINCIGITKPYCHDDDMSEVKNAIYINSLFPHDLLRLAREKGVRIIQIATDCVYSGHHGGYAEDSPHDALDVYGKTKSLGEVHATLFLNIRCSIVGPERNRKVFLLEWFLSNQPGSIVKGFDHHRWNGVTTLQFARLCEEIICGEMFDALTQTSSLHHFVPNEIVTKYELLNVFNRVFDCGLNIEKVSDVGSPVDRTLSTQFELLESFHPSSSIESALRELKEYIDTTGFYDA